MVFHLALHETLIQRKGDGEEQRNENDARLHKPKLPLDKRPRAKILENLRYMENPMLMDLSSTLFGDTKRSVWNGPHSLVRRECPARRSAIHSAMSSFMKG
ncbi:hypothetical protein LIER_17772 [Lithospermum erythrorhizon]|uniref:Uncharacterized protein n=1 Tax=Lithospermum erythrorhizon TaxID=34254 RepID=A0AAV3QE21_LITER